MWSNMEYELSISLVSRWLIKLLGSRPWSTSEATVESLRIYAREQHQNKKASSSSMGYSDRMSECILQVILGFEILDSSQMENP